MIVCTTTPPIYTRTTPPPPPVGDNCLRVFYTCDCTSPGTPPEIWTPNFRDCVANDECSGVVICTPLMYYHEYLLYPCVIGDAPAPFSDPGDAPCAPVCCPGGECAVQSWVCGCDSSNHEEWVASGGAICVPNSYCSGSYGTDLDYTVEEIDGCIANVPKPGSPGAPPIAVGVCCTTTTTTTTAPPLYDFCTTLWYATCTSTGWSVEAHITGCDATCDQDADWVRQPAGGPLDLQRRMCEPGCPPRGCGPVMLNAPDSPDPLLCPPVSLYCTCVYESLFDTDIMLWGPVQVSDCSCTDIDRSTGWFVASFDPCLGQNLVSTPCADCAIDTCTPQGGGTCISEPPPPPGYPGFPPGAECLAVGTCKGEFTAVCVDSGGSYAWEVTYVGGVCEISCVSIPWGFTTPTTASATICGPENACVPGELCVPPYPGPPDLTCGPT